jgi:guanyl-specific ribonuclease Sa
MVGLLVVVVGALIGVNWVGGDDAPASSTASDSNTASVGSGWIDASRLPAEARQVLSEIDHGGPFEYPGKDGSVFGDDERIAVVLVGDGPDVDVPALQR